ncbi:MAG: DnaB-like helicase C-terminal domain-containing protein [Thermomicrobiales bacterium]
MRHISEILQQYFAEVDSFLGNVIPLACDVESRQFAGISTGFSDLDVMITGLHRADLIVIAGESGTGKTSLALGMAYIAGIEHGKAVGIFSLETPAERIFQRLLSMNTGVETGRLQSRHIGDGERDHISRAVDRLRNSPIHIDATATTIEEIGSRASDLKSMRGLDLLILDSLQSISDPLHNDHTHGVATTSRELKRIARDLDIPVVVTSQVSDAVRRRVDHRPIIEKDIHQSIEENADIVIFIYREDQYEEDSDGRGIAEIIIAKHRNGPVGSINLRFFDRTARFTDLEIYPEREL